MADHQRPTIEAVVKMIQTLMTSRRYKNFSLQKVEYIFFPSAYVLLMSWEGKDMKLQIPAELIREAVATGDSFKQRKVKKMIKDALGVKHDD